MSNEQTTSGNNQPTSVQPQAQTGNVNDLIAGSVQGDPVTGRPTQPASQVNIAPKATEETVAKKQYEELETKLGHQGTELGEYREFFNQISPLLDKLDKQPELVQAIIDGKVDGTLAKAVLENKVSVKEAETVTKAHEEVKQAVGQETYNAMKPEEIEKLVSDKIEKVAANLSDNLKKNINESEEMRKWEKKTEDFISSTPDFKEYAAQVDEWLNDHDIDDIEIAYRAVKGEILEKKMKEEEQKNIGEAAKAVASDFGGGPSQNATVVSDKSVVDQLIGGRTNPNIF